MAATPKKPPSKPGPTKRKTRPTTTTLTTNNHLQTTITAVQTAITAAYTFLNTNDLHLLPSQTLSLHSSLSKTLLSLSKFPSFLPQIPPEISKNPSCWFERFVLSSISDDDPRWVHIFRMKKPTFSNLHSRLCSSISSVLGSGFNTHFALGCALYKFAHNGSFQFVGRRFGFSSNEACRAFYGVVKVICAELGGLVSGFGEELGVGLMGLGRVTLPNCCGVLGVERFEVEGEMLGKDGFLFVQGLVACDGRFLDVSAGWPSTFSSVSVLRQTRLYLGVEESKEVLSGPEVEVFDGNLVPQYVLGDSCYPCLPWLVTPFVRKGEGEGLNASEFEFNVVHKRAMRILKMAFGRVRDNWKLLNKRWKEEFVEFLPFMITAACVLNNFLLKHGELLPDGDVDGVEDLQEMPEYDGEVDESAGRTRSLLALHLSRVSQRSQTECALYETGDLVN